jgi:hypothetical protein
VCTLLQEIPSGYLPLACDAWTSSNRIAFLAMTVMWIDDDWELHEVLLDFIEIEGAHTGENMAKYMLESLIDMDLVDMVSACESKYTLSTCLLYMQFISVTADNASNNATLLDSLIKNIKTARDAAVARSDDALADKLDELDPGRSTIRCLAHVIHLAVMALLVSVDAVNDEDAAPPDDETDKFELMTEGEAERIGVPQGAEDNVIVDDDDDDVEARSVVAKVRKIECVDVM